MYKLTTILLIAPIAFRCIGVHDNEYSANKFTSYYKLINEAQYEIIMKNSYTKALTCYKDAFNIVESAFTNDLYNASVCAAYENDIDFLTECIHQLMSKGFSLDTFKKTPFENVLNKSVWKQIETDYQKLKLNTIDSAVLRKINSLVGLDQSVRLHDSSNQKEFLDSIRVVDDLIASELLNVINVNFPSEASLGSTSLDSRHPAEIIFLHRSNLGIDDYLSILKKAVLEGKYHPLYYMKNIDHYDRVLGKYGRYGSDLGHTLNDELWCYNYPDSIEENINNMRESLGFGSLADYKEMYHSYNAKSSDFLFLFLDANSFHSVPENVVERVKTIFKEKGLEPCN